MLHGSSHDIKLYIALFKYNSGELDTLNWMSFTCGYLYNLVRYKSSDLFKVENYKTFSNRIFSTLKRLKNSLYPPRPKKVKKGRRFRYFLWLS